MTQEEEVMGREWCVVHFDSMELKLLRELNGCAKMLYSKDKDRSLEIPERQHKLARKCIQTLNLRFGFEIIQEVIKPEGGRDKKYYQISPSVRVECHNGDITIRRTE